VVEEEEERQEGFTKLFQLYEMNVSISAKPIVVIKVILGERKNNIFSSPCKRKSHEGKECNEPIKCNQS
jgi:hypothetical protein